MKEDETAGDNLENLMFDVCRFGSTTVIPKYFDDNLQPHNSDKDGPTKVLMASSVGSCNGKILVAVCQKFPDCDDFKNLRNDECPKWWTSMQNAFETECVCFQMSLSSNFAFGDVTVLPLHDDNGNGPVKPGHPIDDCIAVVDLFCIASKLMREVDLTTTSINDPQHPNMHPTVLLDQWSGEIMDDCHCNDPEIAPATADMQLLAMKTNQQTDLLMSISDSVTRMEENNNKLQKVCSESQANNSELQNCVAVSESELIAAESQLASAQSKLAFIKMPLPPTTASSAALRQ